MKLKVLAVASLLLSGMAAQVKAAFIPVGVQNDVAVSTVTGAWGWTQIYRDDYNVYGVPISTVFAGASDYVMLGAVNKATDTIHVLAAALTSDVLTYTARDQTHAANGAEWYFNGGSMGFAKLGDSIRQNSADILSTNGAQRLSWHTNGGYASTPTIMNGGWRAGEFIGLNSSTAWEKIVFTASVAPVPEPASIAMWGLGALGLGYARRKRRQMELAGC